MNNTIFFAPELFINNGVKDVSFYEKAFGAIEQMRFSNDDGSIHVVEFSIGGMLFHIHEITANKHFFSPDKNNGTTVTIGLFAPDVDKLMAQAIEAGASEISPAQDYDYGYRQGILKTRLDITGKYRRKSKRIVQFCYRRMILIKQFKH
ncbi:VOC family protein [Emticicia sp. C21]|uniref:VOC family protein n=1 Tax=Emticicia sp. C21 TaxID=2302915 RepID=UPI0018F3C6D4|nr:VOC family protein [Emticicia sp. C21]